MAGKTGKKSGLSRPRNKRDKNFYAPALDEAEKLEFKRAAGVDGIDDEIELLRVEIKKAIESGNADLRSLVLATNALERLIRTRYQITREQRKGLKEAIGNVLKDVALPLGINIGATAIGKRLG
jgi:hypothetical protein